MLEKLRQVREVLPWYASPPQDCSRVIINEMVFKAGEKPGYSFEPNQRDVADIIRNVRRGKQLSDFCIATNHGHEPEEFTPEPPDYEQTFARMLIDAGADIYLNHGPHHVRGIEIYKGRPIFYGLGNLFNQDLRTPIGADMYEAHGKDPRVDSDADVTAHEMAVGYPYAEGFVALSDAIYYESIISVARYESNRLSELRLHPIELRRSDRLANRGVPRLTAESQGKTILERLQKNSEPFGTTLEVENGVGLIRLPSR